MNKNLHQSQYTNKTGDDRYLNNGNMKSSQNNIKDTERNKNFVANKQNDQPVFYTPTLSKDHLSQKRADTASDGKTDPHFDQSELQNDPNNQVSEPEATEGSKRVSLDSVINHDEGEADTAVELTDLGGPANRAMSVDENSDAPLAGTPGHPGVDEDTA